MSLLSASIATGCGGNTTDPAVSSEAGGGSGIAATGGAPPNGGGTFGTAASGAPSNTGAATIWDGGAPASHAVVPGLTGGTPGSDVNEPGLTGGMPGSGVNEPGLTGGMPGSNGGVANGGVSSTGGKPSASAGISSVTGGQGTGGTQSSSVTVGGSNGGATQDASCAAYNAARALPDGLLEACRIASSGLCKATLQEYLAGQSALAKISLAEGCGTRTVGWDVRLGGRLFTYDANDALLGFKLWDDVPNGPCRASGTFSYSMGSSRTTLIQASASCAEDVVCTVALTDAGQLHCPAGIGEVVVGDIQVNTQADLDKYAGVKKVTGSIVLHGDITLTSLKPLAALETIEGDLVLEWMYNLRTVEGLSSLRTIGGDLSITHSNIATVNLEALSSVKRIGGNYEVSDCNGASLLTSIGVENIGGTVIAAGSSDC